MKIKTFQFGEIEFKEENLIKFNSGIFGFEDFKDFVLIKTENDLFYWLNSTENPEICFPVVGIRVLDDKYPFEENYEAFGIVTLNEDPRKITVNLKAPIYINQDDKKGFQKVLDTDNYNINHHLFIEE